jgi:hypothetical protein
MSFPQRLFGPKRLTAVIVGALIAIAGTALALVVVTLSTSVTSTAFAGEGLALNVVDTGTTSACEGSGSYETTATVPAVSYDLANASQTTGSFLCIKNDGFTTMSNITVDLTASNSSDGGCTSEEGAAETGSGCQGGGDLEAVLQFDLTKVAFDSGGGQCATVIHVSTTSGDVVIPNGNTMSTGAQCVYRVDLSLQSGVTTQQRTAASTDSVDFSLDVTGS